MMCFFCKGDLENSNTTYVVNLKSRVIIVRNVPCEECTQCGETFFDDVVMERLENIVNSLGTVLTEVAIVNYPDKVA